MQTVELEIPIPIKRKTFEDAISCIFFNSSVLKLEYLQSDNLHHKYLVHYMYPQDLIKIGEIKQGLHRFLPND